MSYITIESLLNDEYLFPAKTPHPNSPLYDIFQRSARQLRSDICQTHHTLWNDGIDRTGKNELRFNLKYIDQLFQCIFHEDKGEKTLMEKNIQSFANYCFQRIIQVLLEKNMKLNVDVEPTNVTIRLEINEDSDRTDIEQLNITLSDIKKFFEVVNTYVLLRVMNVQTSKEE